MKILDYPSNNCSVRPKKCTKFDRLRPGLVWDPPQIPLGNSPQTYRLVVAELAERNTPPITSMFDACRLQHQHIMWFVPKMFKVIKSLASFCLSVCHRFYMVAIFIRL